MSDNEEDIVPPSEAKTQRMDLTTQPLEQATIPRIEPDTKNIPRHLMSVKNGFLAFAQKVSLESRQRNPRESKEPRLAGLLKELGTLAGTIASITESSNEDTDFCLGCICEFLKRTTNKNAAELQRFNSGNLCQLEFESTAAKLSSVPLTEHMKRLRSGDHYDVVSDLASWRDDQLSEFLKETGKAVKKGAFVRRIFNLMLKHSYNPVASDDMESILRDHLNKSEEWNRDYRGRYDVAVFGAPNLIDLKKADPSVRRAQFATEVHFGIFSREGEGKTLVEYEVRAADVSRMILRNDDEAIGDHLRTFEAVWRVAPKLADLIEQKPVIDVVLEDPERWMTP